MTAILEARQLRKVFGVTPAVDDVDFSIDTGTRTALIGPNGAGKSTLFELLGGGLSADNGHIAFNGADITAWPPMRRAQAGIARTFQIAAVFRSMTALENVQTALLATVPGCGGLRAASGAFKGEAEALLDTVGIAAAMESAVTDLAYGDVKRLELAMALAGNPQLLLLDEPTAGMAAAERRRIMERTTGIADARGIALLFTEHDMDTVFGFADRVMVMHEGKIVADGAPDDVRADPLVRRIYLGADADA